MNNQDRSCFTCSNYKLCGARQKIHEAVNLVTININSEDSPGNMYDIFKAFAEACIDYNPKKDIPASDGF